MLLPTIFIHWQDYQRKILDRLKILEDLVISGDGRHDSMGHSAKYCAYTIFCCNSPQIIHFSLIQVMKSPLDISALQEQCKNRETFISTSLLYREMKLVAALQWSMKALKGAWISSWANAWTYQLLCQTDIKQLPSI